jgi:hypothetical protein
MAWLSRTRGGTRPDFGQASELGRMGHVAALDPATMEKANLGAMWYVATLNLAPAGPVRSGPGASLDADLSSGRDNTGT